MQTAHNLNKKKKVRTNQEIATTEGTNFAIKLPDIGGIGYEGPL